MKNNLTPRSATNERDKDRLIMIDAGPVSRFPVLGVLPLRLLAWIREGFFEVSKDACCKMATEMPKCVSLWNLSFVSLNLQPIIISCSDHAARVKAGGPSTNTRKRYGSIC